MRSNPKAGTWRRASGEHVRRRGGEGPGPVLPSGPHRSNASPSQFGAIHVRCLLTPGHTSGHMSYFLWEDDCPDSPALFSGTVQPGFIYLPNSTVPSLPPSDPLCSLGDALSVAGCGWHLEDTAQQMYQSLAKTLGTLPPETVSLRFLWGPLAWHWTSFRYLTHAFVPVLLW